VCLEKINSSINTCWERVAVESLSFFFAYVDVCVWYKSSQFPLWALACLVPFYPLREQCYLYSLLLLLAVAAAFKLPIESKSSTYTIQCWKFNEKLNFAVVPINWNWVAIERGTRTCLRIHRAAFPSRAHILAEKRSKKSHFLKQRPPSSLN
jgi:hypothetical protein